MALFQLLANERSPHMTNYFRQMPVADLRLLKLWNHLKNGDPEQQMAAFRLSRVLYHTLPPDQFRHVLNGKQGTIDIFNRMHAQWLRDNPSGLPAAPGLAAAPLAAAGGKTLAQPVLREEAIRSQLPAVRTSSPPSVETQI
jgi:hypothetical protein